MSRVPAFPQTESIAENGDSSRSFRGRGRFLGRALRRVGTGCWNDTDVSQRITSGLGRLRIDRDNGSHRIGRVGDETIANDVGQADDKQHRAKAEQAYLQPVYRLRPQLPRATRREMLRLRERICLGRRNVSCHRRAVYITLPAKGRPASSSTPATPHCTARTSSGSPCRTGSSRYGERGDLRSPAFAPAPPRPRR
ncbi:hypothetical protein WSK_1652 [Novosphingobium sp. Rr 2-17]|nr:hypothetical protein WSK_1652 [Novosphingobium sp. Rr 2-17]